MSNTDDAELAAVLEAAVANASPSSTDGDSKAGDSLDDPSASPSVSERDDADDREDTKCV